MKFNVAIISSDTLLAIGLNHILAESFGVKATMFATAESAKSNGAESFDFYFTDSETFAMNLDFFLPKKPKTIIVTNHCASEGDDIKSISRYQSESALIEQFNAWFSTADKNETPQNGLSQREIEVLRLIASGLINKEIADALAISINTVLTHRKNITAKLGIRSVSGLSFYAMMNGIISPEK